MQLKVSSKLDDITTKPLMPFSSSTSDELTHKHSFSFKVQEEVKRMVHASYMMVSSRELYLWISCSRTTFSGDGSSWNSDLVPS